MGIIKYSKLLTLGLFLLCSCSFNGSSNSRSLASLGDSTEAESLELAETSEDGVVSIISSEIKDYEEVVADAASGPRQDSIMDAALATPEYQEEVKEEVHRIIESESKFEEYVVQQGDTLMILAFRLYRDVFKWREIAQWNKERLNPSNDITPGDILRIKVLDLPLDTWQPMGDPYLIMQGDSLTKISKNVYEGTMKYWRDIWSNNPLLIKNPNIIYAGFTLYYLPIEEVKRNRVKSRQLASKK